MVDCWYKFERKRRHRILTAEEAETELSKRRNASGFDRWLMRQKYQVNVDQDETLTLAERKAQPQKRQILAIGDDYQDDRGLFTDEEGSKEGIPQLKRRRRVKADSKEVDYDYDQEFQDDEDAMIPMEMMDEETRIQIVVSSNS